MQEVTDSSCFLMSTSAAQPNQPVHKTFDPAAGLPPRLQSRIDSWARHSPKSQFQQYGPMTAYLGIKFPPNRFLIKPQALLRQESAELPDKEDVPVDSQGNRDGGRKKKGRISIDSHGVPVTEDGKKYPDFTVCHYFGSYSEGHRDIVRVVLEIVSTDDKPARMWRQLGEYMDMLGERWEHCVLGIALKGRKVLMIKHSDNPQQPWLYIGADGIVPLGEQARFMSLFDDRLVQEINEIRDFCLQVDPDSNYVHENEESENEEGSSSEGEEFVLADSEADNSEDDELEDEVMADEYDLNY